MRSVWTVYATVIFAALGLLSLRQRLAATAAREPNSRFVDGSDKLGPRGGGGGLRDAVRLPSIHAVILVRIYAEDPARWTTYELDQWVEYMSYAGISRVYLYDARQDAAESLRAWSRRWRCVVYVDWAEFSRPYSLQRTHLGAYAHAIRTYGNASDWQIAFDMDEYPFSPIDREAGFLRRQVHRLTSDAARVAELSLANFLFVDAPCSGARRVIDRIVRRTTTAANSLDKPIYRPTRVRHVGFHHNSVNGTSVDVPAAELRMNHYWGLRLQNWGDPCTSDGCWNESDVSRYTVLDQSAAYISHQLALSSLERSG